MNDTKHAPSHDHAVALRYSERDRLPRVVASGAGEVAHQIVALAKSHDIPLREDRALSDILKTVAVGSYVTPESFALVAEVITYLYHLDEEWRKTRGHLDGIIGPPLNEDTKNVRLK